MELLEAIILGIIQGLTEFLPVSSSGHIELVKAMFDREDPFSDEMTIVLHFATALSTCVIFRKDILEIFQGLFQFKNNDQFKFSIKIILSMIPAAIVGLSFENEIKSLFNSNVLLVGLMLIVTGLLLLVADKATATKKKVSFGQAIIIGIAQAIAILPGISRSGATISTSVLLGIDREKAARFSFLMVVPLIFGKIAKDLLDLIKEPAVTDNVSYLPYVLGFAFAFVTGLIACTWMIKLVKSSKLYYFSIYCFIVGIAAIIYTFL
ncbi:MAG: undecaprenyl-diphosphatase UppP [Flavobacteriales bacterium]|jgi:undecaprenyl-diphosphatase|nr:undecaprenyl-diphosphatase UppP [bacterium]MDB9931663.1 undecaprenyl-diphosphatase UppP [Flavobacteriales bacterium]MDG1176345.1 undecaprenyl-diphosphatase UppP [Flavobacteriales bacterium]